MSGWSRYGISKPGASSPGNRLAALERKIDEEKRFEETLRELREAPTEADFAFIVRSASSATVYRLEATRTSRGVRFTCTCPAGEKAQHCKHRIGILLGDPHTCVDVDPGDLSAFHDMAAGTALAEAVDAYTVADTAKAEADREFVRAKKALTRALMG